jgi:hypothetical protein
VNRTEVKTRVARVDAGRGRRRHLKSTCSAHRLAHSVASFCISIAQHSPRQRLTVTAYTMGRITTNLMLLCFIATSAAFSATCWDNHCYQQTIPSIPYCFIPSPKLPDTAAASQPHCTSPLVHQILEDHVAGSDPDAQSSALYRLTDGAYMGSYERESPDALDANPMWMVQCDTGLIWSERPRTYPYFTTCNAFNTIGVYYGGGLGCGRIRGTNP